MDKLCAFLSKTRTFVSDPKLVIFSHSKVKSLVNLQSIVSNYQGRPLSYRVQNPVSIRRSAYCKPRDQQQALENHCCFILTIDQGHVSVPGSTLLCNARFKSVGCGIFKPYVVKKKVFAY